MIETPRIRDAGSVAATISREAAGWLEDVLAGLLINGVQRADIAIEHHPMRIVVTVSGTPKYEWSVRLVNRHEANKA